MSKDHRVYLAHILDRIDRIIEYTESGREAFFSNPMIQDAVIRNLEIIGEAAKRIPDDFRAAHNSIPWKSLAALRDVLIHQYEGVSLPEVWQMVEVHIPGLRVSIGAIVPPMAKLEQELSEGAGDE